jgi:hypothetical protein
MFRSDAWHTVVHIIFALLATFCQNKVILGKESRAIERTARALPPLEKWSGAMEAPKDAGDRSLAPGRI